MQKPVWISRITPFGLIVCLAAAAKFTLHMLTGSHYGFFCDELYIIAFSRHLAFGYVDLPPLVPALVAASRAILGESLTAMHVVPSLAGAVTLVFACLIARELGGKRFATAVTAVGFIIAPVWLILDSFFCYDSIDQLLLAVFLFLLVRLLKTGNAKLWIGLGATAGLACLAKVTILFLAPGLFLALILSKNRVYDGLPPEDRKVAGIWGDWYGPAGAIDLFGPKYGLPHAVSGHLTYSTWGPGYTWDVMILVTAFIDSLRGFFSDVELKDVIRNDFAMPYNALRIYVARGPRMAPSSIWTYMRYY
jgi:hypothetical protein